jgi:uncharacterized membrane protein YhfC
VEPLPLDLGLVAAFLVAVAVEIAFPLLVGAWLARRFGLHWIVFIYGAVVFVVAQLLIRIPLVALAQVALAPVLVADQGGMRTWAWIGVLVLTAGLFEETGRWLGYRWFFQRMPRTWANALLYGAGHAGAESILLVGLSVFSSLATYLVLTQGVLPVLPGQDAQFAALHRTFADLPAWAPLLGAVERVLALAFHVSASVLVLQVFVRRNLAWLGVSILWHGFTNLVVVGLARWLRGLPDLPGWVSWVGPEVALAAIAVASLGIILSFRPAVPEASSPPLLSLAPAGTTEGAAGDRATPVATRLSLVPAGEVEPAPPAPPEAEEHR